MSEAMDLLAAPPASAATPADFGGRSQVTLSVRTLHGRLPRIDAEHSAALNHVYGAASRSTLSAFGQPYQLQWMFRPRQSTPQLLVDLRLGEDRLVFAQLGAAALEGAPALTVAELSGTAQLLAWTLLNEPLLDHLGLLLGGTLEPQAVLPASDSQALDASLLRLDFALLRGDGLTVLQGSLYLPVQRALQLQAALGQARQNLDAIPVACTLRLAQLELRASELQGVERGDVLLVGSKDLIKDGALLRLQPRGADYVWRVALRGKELVLRAVESAVPADERGPLVRRRPQHSGEQAMEQSSPVAAASVPPAESDQINALPVSLSFDIGRLDVPIGTLKQLGTGHVFTLERKLDQAPVSIKANGVELGTGELVLVGDVLGVRVTALRA